MHRRLKFKNICSCLYVLPGFPSEVSPSSSCFSPRAIVQSLSHRYQYASMFSLRSSFLHHSGSVAMEKALLIVMWSAVVLQVNAVSQSPGSLDHMDSSGSGASHTPSEIFGSTSPRTQHEFSPTFHVPVAEDAPMSPRSRKFAKLLDIGLEEHERQRRTQGDAFTGRWLEDVWFPHMRQQMERKFDPLDTANLAKAGHDESRLRRNATMHFHWYPDPGRGRLRPPWPGPRTLLRTGSLPSSLWRYHNKLNLNWARRKHESANAPAGLGLFMQNSIVLSDRLRNEQHRDMVKASQIQYRLDHLDLSEEGKKRLRDSLTRLHRSVANADTKIRDHVSGAEKLWKAGQGSHTFHRALEKSGHLQSLPNHGDGVRRVIQAQWRPTDSQNPHRA